jgi:hypothetical protein
MSRNDVTQGPNWYHHPELSRDQRFRNPSEYLTVYQALVSDLDAVWTVPHDGHWFLLLEMLESRPL